MPLPTYQPYTVSRMMLYKIHGDTHAIYTIKVNVAEHEPYKLNGETLDTNPLHIMHVNYITTIQYHPYKTYC